MATINILIAVDAAALASRIADKSLAAGAFTTPTCLGAYKDSDVYIAMIAPNSYVTNGTQGQSELKVTALSGDTVEWAITTFDNNFDYTVFLYNGQFNPPEAMGKLSYNCGQGYVCLDKDNPPQNPGHPVKFTNQVSTVDGKILQVNKTIQYYMSFALVDNRTGKIIGYFMWDPFIIVP